MCRDFRHFLVSTLNMYCKIYQHPKYFADALEKKLQKCKQLKRNINKSVVFKNKLESICDKFIDECMFYVMSWFQE